MKSAKLAEVHSLIQKGFQLSLIWFCPLADRVGIDRLRVFNLSVAELLLGLFYGDFTHLLSADQFEHVHGSLHQRFAPVAWRMRTAALRLNLPSV